MRFAIALSSVVLLSSFGFSATIYVPDNYFSIQAAISASSSGDVIVVRPGTYLENISFVGKAITVVSEKGPALTVIDGNVCSVVTFNHGEGPHSVLKGFTLTSGIGTVEHDIFSYPAAFGGGIYCRDASPTVIDNIITGNSTGRANRISGFGGGIASYFGSPRIIHNSIKSNKASEFGGGIFSYNSDLEISQNVIDGNSAEFGGGVSCEGCSSKITCNVISKNTSSMGSGIWVQYDSSPVILKNSIVDNIAITLGGGIFSQNNTSLEIVNNTIARNSGNGIYCHRNGISTPSIILDNIIADNASCGTGGGIYCSSGIYRIENNVITGNSVSSPYRATCGGGIYCGVCSHTIAGNIIGNNISKDYGGGISIHLCSDSFITNNTIAQNTTGTIGGGGIYCDCSDPNITNTVLWGNIAPLGNEIFVVGDSILPSHVTLSYSDLKDRYNSVHVEPGSMVNWGNGMIDVNPLFVDPAVGDFHLPYDSPCRNAGDGLAPGLPSDDFEGDPRVFCGCVDIGADEFHPHLYYTGKAVPGGTVDVKIIAPPTVWACLLRGSGIEDPPLTTPYGDFHLSRPLLGKWTTRSIPLNGVKHISVPISSAVPPGKVFPFQALVGPIATYPSLLTNLLVLEVE